MEIKRTWEHLGNPEKETKLYKILNRITINWQYVGQGDFTPGHSLFNCCIKDNNNNNYIFTYQCNTKYTKPNETSLLSCLVSDAFCFNDCVIGNDEDNIQEFGEMFGYENIKELLKAYKGCKEAYFAIKKIFTDNELDILREYFEEVGEW